MTIEIGNSNSGIPIGSYSPSTGGSSGGGGGGDISGTDNTFTGKNTFNGTTVVNSATFKVTVNPDTGASAQVFSSRGVFGNTPKIGDTGAKVFLDNTNVLSRVDTTEGTQTVVSIQNLYNRAMDTYTIDESDELFDGKENKLTATDPVVISDSIINPTENMTIGSTGDIVSNYPSWTNNGYRGGMWSYQGLSGIQAGQKFLDVMKTLGAIFIPFTFGNIYASPAVATSNNDGGDIPPIAIGYYVNDTEFIPVLTFDTESFAKKFTSSVLTAGSYTLDFSTDYAFNNIQQSTPEGENRPAFGNLYFQVFKTDINTYKYTMVTHWPDNLKIKTATIDSSIYSELSKCTHIMFGPTYKNGYSSSSSKYSLSSHLDAQAKYNTDTNFKEFAFTKDLATVVGTTDEFNFQELMASGENKIKLEQTVVHNIALGTSVTLKGNTFNGANQLVQLDSTGKLPAIDGSQLTNLPSSIPSNMVTTDTEQFITGRKTISDLQVSGAGGIKDDRGVPFIQTSQINDIWNWVLGSNNSTNFKEIYIRRNTSGEYINIDSGNISDYLSTGGLKYWTGAETDYTAIETKDADTLYRTTDTNKVFLGTIQLGGNA